MKKMNRSIVAGLVLLTLGQGALTNVWASENAESTQVESTVSETEKVGFTGDYIISVEDLKAKMADENVIVIDARGPEVAAKGHLKGALALAWQDLSDVADKNPGEEGWGHLLAADKLATKLGELGLAKDKEIILYSVANAGWGEDGRILWALKSASYDKVKMVDGGFAAIEKAGLEVDKEEVKFEPVTVEVTELDRKNTLDTKELTDTIKDYKLVDTREQDEYDGATLYGEAKGGHLPGAINIPYTALYTEEGLLKSNDELLALFEEKGLQKEDAIVTYCTGGIRSAYMQLVLEMIGFENVKNYEGSYYNWAAVNEVEK